MGPRIGNLLLGLILLLLMGSPLAAHEYKITVLIDADMALDDVRAIAMALNSDHIVVPLIVTSDGAVPPRTGYLNLRRVLEFLSAGDTEIAVGKAIDKPAPPWRPWSENLGWAKIPKVKDRHAEFPAAAERIVEILNSVEQKATYLCLGPMTNLAEALRMDPKIKEKISSVVFLGSHPETEKPGWNSVRDRGAATLVFRSGITIFAMYRHDELFLPFDRELYERIKQIGTPAATLVAKLHEDPRVSKLLNEGHFRAWDESAVMFLYQPSLFRFVPLSGNDNVMCLDHYDIEAAGEIYVKLLSYPADHHLTVRKPVVLSSFPSDPAGFREDVKPYVKKIIERHGLEEWKVCVLVHELHRHLGIYSVIGAKMGMRAREILHAPLDSLRVISLAGSKPPISCMNDGLQVATGASLGRGTIEVDPQQHEPAAVFLHKGQRLTLRTKSDLRTAIRDEWQTAEKKFGGMNPEYFRHMRKLSLEYWLKMDRQNIFDEVIE